MSSSEKICLNMIVKNESAILERCLSSVAPWIDYYVIGDTGSTDGTPDLIRDFFTKREISGEVHSFPFENFEQARNEALQLCLTSAGDFKYILLTDADMELVVEDPEFRSRLTAPVYMVKQVADISYRNVRFLHRATLPLAKYVGLTHEYLHVPAPMAHLDEVWFKDHAEGSSRVEKTERDIRLLKESLKNDPTNPRTMFYLAQTYKDIGNYRDAIKYYRQRIQAGGFAEEVWYSRYMIAVCLKELGDWQDFVIEALAAYQERPTRAEPLLLLSTYYRQKGQNDLAVLMSETGVRIPHPTDSLFVEDHVYRHGFKQELSIAGFYSPRPHDKERARRLCLELAIDKSAPEYIRNTAIHNSAFYAVSVKDAFKARTVKLEASRSAETADYVTMNPSIWIRPDGEILCNLRWVNYQLPNYSTPDGIVRTKNELVIADAASWLSAADVIEIDAATSYRYPINEDLANVIPHAQVLGLEDMRIFAWRDGIWASATVRDRNPTMRAEMALVKLELSDRQADRRAFVDRVHVQRRVHPELHQKNWIPLVDPLGKVTATGGNNEDLYFVYSSDPTVVLRCDPATLQCESQREDEPPFALDNLRGSSQAIPFVLTSEHLVSEPVFGWLYVVHEAFARGESRQYTHRLVWMNEALQIKYVSDPFYFISTEIEFCAGLARHETDIVFSFGVNDSSAHLAVANIQDVAAWLTHGKRGYAYP